MKPDTGKPHLKLHLSGAIEVLASRHFWNVGQADAFIKRHYGSRAAFAACYGFDYGTVCAALRGDHGCVRQAGGVELVRKFLGLRSNPTDASRRQSFAFYRSRGLQPLWKRARVFATGMDLLQ